MFKRKPVLTGCVSNACPCISMHEHVAVKIAKKNKVHSHVLPWNLTYVHAWLWMNKNWSKIPETESMHDHAWSRLFVHDNEWDKYDSKN